MNDKPAPSATPQPVTVMGWVLILLSLLCGLSWGFLAGVVSFFALGINGRLNLVLLVLGVAVNGQLAYQGVRRGAVTVVVVVHIILPIVGGFFIGSAYGSAQEGFIEACKNAQHRVVEPALALYATDNAGQFPDSLGKLTPKYLKSLPRCMGAEYGGGTRWPWSVAGRDGEYGYVSTPDHRGYTVFCQGIWHRRGGVLTPNYPQYGSEGGLVLPW